MTNEEVNALTDQQINVMMTFAVNDLDESWDQSQGGTFVFYCAADGNSDTTITVEDYCNDHVIMMPIVFENGIALSPTRQTDGEMTWTAGYFMGRVVTKFTHANPLRAAAIVYLKMKLVL